METNHPSAEELEQQASRERAEVERTFTEARHDLRREMDLRLQIRRRPLAAYGVATLVSFVAGYRLVRLFR
jgi:hypothetical protein